jgi:NAD(P)H dehydrogenase (quinone)
VGLGGSMTQVQDESALIDAAAKAGAEYLVRLSCNGVDTSTKNVILDGHRAVEGHLAGAGIASTLVRPSTFIDAIVRIASQFIPQDVWGGNDGGGTCTFIDTRDVAEVFALLLTQGPGAHDGRVYTLTGPEAVTMPRVAQLISAAAGREVVRHERTEAESESFLNGLGLPALQVAVLLGLDQFVREGTMSEVHDVTQALLGKPARTAAAYVSENASLLQPAS